MSGDTSELGGALGLEGFAHELDQLAAREAEAAWRLRPVPDAWDSDTAVHEWLTAAEAQAPAAHVIDVFDAIDTDTMPGSALADIAHGERARHWQRALSLLGPAGNQRVPDYGPYVLPPRPVATRSFVGPDGKRCLLEARGTVFPVGMQAGVVSRRLLGAELPVSDLPWHDGQYDLASLAFKAVGLEAVCDAKARLRNGMLREGAFPDEDVARIQLGMMINAQRMDGTYVRGSLRGLHHALTSRSGGRWNEIVGPRTALTGVVLRYGLEHKQGMFRPQEVVVPRPDLPVTAALEVPLPGPRGLLARVRSLAQHRLSTASTVRTAHEHGSDAPWQDRDVRAVAFDSPEGRAYMGHPVVAARLRQVGDFAVASVRTNYLAVDELLAKADV